MIERFLANPGRSETECWPYPGSINKQTGYGKCFSPMTGGTGDAHRVAYLLTFGSIPDGMQVDHLCRNRACCNPRHMEPVTHGENLRRGDTFLAEQLRRTHCPKGHPLSGDNLYIDPKRGKRGCKACRRVQSNAAYHRKVGH